QSSKGSVAAVGCGSGKRPRGSEKPRTGTPANVGNHELFTVRRKSDGDGIKCGLGLHGPKFLAGVSGVGGKFAGALSLKNQVTSCGYDASVDGDLLLDGPARRLRNGVPCDQPAEESFSAFSRFYGSLCVRAAVRRR